MKGRKRVKRKEEGRKEEMGGGGREEGERKPKGPTEVKQLSHCSPPK